MPWFLRPRRLIAAIVLATVSFLIWAMGIPNLPDGRLVVTEVSAIAVLKNVHAQQQQFMAQKAIDRDGDGRGEAGFLEELAGSRPLRPSHGATGRRLEPALLGQAFAALEAGRVYRLGYWFQLYLPTADGRWVGSVEEARKVGIDASEGAYCMYAWPDRQTSGKRAFFVDAVGQVLASRNPDWRYCGCERPVPVDAALPTSALVQQEVGARVGRDGQAWCVVE